MEAGRIICFPYSLYNLTAFIYSFFTIIVTLHNIWKSDIKINIRDISPLHFYILVYFIHFLSHNKITNIY